jgi:hypothetical protein
MNQRSTGGVGSLSAGNKNDAASLRKDRKCRRINRAVFLVRGTEWSHPFF